MPVLQVRNLPSDIYKRLQDSAEREHRSLAQQTIVLLKQALAMGNDTRDRREKLLEAFRKRPLGGSKNWDATALVREDRER